MLKNLSIRNLAIIDLVELDFADGFTVLTGETGAGKSILIDAIGLAIGLRADANLVRAGQEKAEISASFELEPKAPARRWLADNELADPDDPTLLVLRRRSEEHTSELQSLTRIAYAVFCLKKKQQNKMRS